VPFNVVRHPSFIATVRATLLARFDYEPPSYHAMRTTFIEPTRKHVEAKVKKATKQSIEIYGATICTYGWMEQCYTSITNERLGSIDMSGNKKTKAYITMELKKFIDDVGPRLVTQICTDNATNMLGAMDNIVMIYPHIFKPSYAAYALDLMLEDWANIDQFKDLTNKAKCMCLGKAERHAEPPRNHGTILGELSEKIFDSASGYTIFLPIPHDKSNA
jgi:hypothetical protein